MFLRKIKAKGHIYYDLVEGYREHGKVKHRVLQHLGSDLLAPETLIKWWEFLGKPRLPARRGRHPGKPCAEIFSLEKFFQFNYSQIEAARIATILEAITLKRPLDKLMPVSEGISDYPRPPTHPDVFLEAQAVFRFDQESGQILDSSGLKIEKPPILYPQGQKAPEIEI